MIFQDRIDAATKLAEKLEWLKKEKPLILAIPRGGVIIGDVIASKLCTKLDIVVSRKVGAPYTEELAIGAVMHDGSFFPNEDIINTLSVSQNYIDTEISAQMKEIERRLKKFRGNTQYDIEGKTVVLVDDGVATGATMFVAGLWVKRQKPKKLIIALPVGPKETMNKLRTIADQIVVLHCPFIFNAVAEFYKNFDQVDDSTINEIMKKYGHNLP